MQRKNSKKQRNIRKEKNLRNKKERNIILNKK